MSKYPVQYHSESHGTDVEIETMHSSHLSNAFRKTCKRVHEDTDWPETLLVLVDSMKEELESRGATADASTGEVTWPPNPEEVQP